MFYIGILIVSYFFGNAVASLFSKMRDETFVMFHSYRRYKNNDLDLFGLICLQFVNTLLGLFVIGMGWAIISLTFF